MKRWLLTIAILFGFVTPAFPIQHLTRNQPGRMVNEFLDFIGARVRLSEGQNPAQLKPLFDYVGFHRVMDSYMAPSSALLSFGKLIFLEVGRSANDATIPAFIAAAKAYPPVSLYAFVGPDEPEHYPISYQGITCGMPPSSWHCVAAWQRDWYKAIKADPVLKWVHVTSPSDVSRETTNEGLQFYTIPNFGPGLLALNPSGTKFWDLANIHGKHSTGRPPGINSGFFQYAPYGFPFDGDPLLENVATSFHLTWNGFVGTDDVGTGNLPSINTSATAYMTDGSAAGDQLKGLHDLVNWVENFFPSRGTNSFHGPQGSFVQLVDTPETAGRGFYKDYAHPRPSATWTHNLTTWLADSAAPFTPDHMIWDITGDDGNFRSIGLQKTTGQFEVVAIRDVFAPNAEAPETRVVSWPTVMHDIRVFDPVLNMVTATYPSAQSISVIFSSTSPMQVIEYTP